MYLMELNTHQTQILNLGDIMWKTRIEVLIMFLNLLRKKAFVAGRIVHRNLLRLNWEKCTFFILLLIEFMPFFYRKSFWKRERKRGVRTTTYTVYISKGKCFYRFDCVFCLRSNRSTDTKSACMEAHTCCHRNGCGGKE